MEIKDSDVVSNYECTVLVVSKDPRRATIHSLKEKLKKAGVEITNPPSDGKFVFIVRND